jgi:putative ABC transport system permease protein
MLGAMRRFIRRLITLLRHTRAESELAREISAHLQLLEDEFVSKGMTREDACCAARRSFGGVEQAKELQRDARSFRWLAGWPMDITLGARMLVKSPGLTVIAVIALAVAFGAGATYLEFVNGMVRPSLSHPGGDRLIGILSRDIEKNSIEKRVLADFRVWRDQLTLLEDLVAWQEVADDLVTSDGRAEPAAGVKISAAAFRLTPASPLMGRPLVDGDEHGSSPAVAVIGEALWTSRFNRDPQIVGRTVLIGSDPLTIVGVMPKAYGFPVNHNLWIPFRDQGEPLQRGEGPPISIAGRLAPGISVSEAAAELSAVAARGTTADVGAGQQLRREVKAYVPSIVAGLDLNRQVVALYTVNLVFVALLLLCAANVATLVFGRTVTRGAEITVRTALGASRGRIVAQLVAEAGVLSSIAAVIGLSAARLALGSVRSAWEQGLGSAMPFWWHEQLGLETYLYTFLLVAIAASIIGGIPALKATGPAMQHRLKDAGAGSTMKFGKLWTGVIVSQVAVTVVFLLSVVALGWAIITLEQQYREVSFRRADYLTASLTFTGEQNVSDVAEAYRTRQELLRRLRQAPSIAHVTYTTRLPGADQEDTDVDIDGVTSSVRVAHVGPDFFETFARPVVAGRGFTEGELATGANVAIVDESFVRHALGGRPAVGQQIREPHGGAGGAPGPFIEIIGVTADISTAERKTIKDARVYRPIGALPVSPVRLVVHAQSGYRAQGLAEVATVLRETAATSRGIVVSSAGPMDGGGQGNVIGYVFTALAIIGAIALLLSTAGIYALVSFTLARRIRDISIRIALGASPRRIITGILWRVMLQIGAGLVAGALPGIAIVGSVAATAGRNALVSGISAAAAAAVFVFAIAIAACSAPLRRALCVDPTEALRAS